MVTNSCMDRRLVKILIHLTDSIDVRQLLSVIVVSVSKVSNRYSSVFSMLKVQSPLLHGHLLSVDSFVIA
jgi:hypothetical protein